MLRCYFFTLLTLLGAVYAQEGESLDDSLFGGDEVVEAQEEESGDANDSLFGDSFFSDVEEDAGANPADDLLTSDRVTLGGDFRVAADINLGLNPAEDEDAFLSGLEELRTRLYLDARPDADFRAFVKTDLSYETEDGLSLDLREAFADIDISNQVFIRGGKQTVNWGVGLFFSPANLINLETIDPEDTDAELAGPVSVKAQVPVGTSNATGYLLLDDIDSGADIGVAARYEFLLEGFEVTVGGVLRNERPWAVMATATGSVEDVTVFGEVVLEGNVDKIFVTEDPNSPSGYSAAASDDVYVSATFGARYSYTTEDDLYTVSGAAQYYFNGLGYADPSVLTDNPAVVGGFIANGDLSFNDLRERSQHYLAANVTSPDIAGSDFTPSALWLGSLGDGSGFATAELSYTGIDNFTPSVGYRLNYGPDGAEYSPLGTRHSLRLGFVLEGAF